MRLFKSCGQEYEWTDRNCGFCKHLGSICPLVKEIADSHPEYEVDDALVQKFVEIDKFGSASKCRHFKSWL